MNSSDGTDTDRSHSLHVKDRNGCRSVSKVETTFCDMNKCRHYGLRNMPLSESTIKVSMRCQNGTVFPNKLFAKVHGCGCLP